jgi:hypothetical protein
LGLKKWVMRKGIVGIIARDICKKYSMLKDSFESEKELIEGVWGLWLTKNAFDDNLDRQIRLSIILEDYERGGILGRQNESLVDVFSSALYIETEISSQDYDLYKTSLEIFGSECKKILNVDLTNIIKQNLQVLEYLHKGKTGGSLF